MIASNLQDKVNQAVSAKMEALGIAAPAPGTQNYAFEHYVGNVAMGVMGRIGKYRRSNSSADLRAGDVSVPNASLLLTHEHMDLLDEAFAHGYPGGNLAKVREYYDARTDDGVTFQQVERALRSDLMLAGIEVAEAELGIVPAVMKL